MNTKSIVLCVEDDDQLRETIQMIIESTGREAWLARNGNEALAILEREIPRMPDLIILDMMMPEMDGTEFLARKLLDSRIAQIPVLVATAVQNIQFPPGAVKLRYKPFELQDLIEDMEAICPLPRP